MWDPSGLTGRAQAVGKGGFGEVREEEQGERIKGGSLGHEGPFKGLL